MSAVHSPSNSATRWAWIAIVLACLGSVLVIEAASPDAGMFLGLSALIAAAGALLIPRAARREGSLGARFLGLALGAHILGSLIRYEVIQIFYHGVSDANGYFGAGSLLYQQFRTLNPPAFPHTGTPFMNYVTGMFFAFTSPTMLGGFVVCSALGFVGCWYFYKAFRLAFPQGDHRLFAWLIFFLPSMWYWPSSLGKDSLMVLFLGWATYGFASILRGIFTRGALLVGAGLFGIIMLRPPMAAALAVAGAAAFLLRPARARSVQLQALMYFVFVPLLAGVAFLSIKSTQSYIRGSSPASAVVRAQGQQAAGSGGSSNFQPPNPFSPIGFPESFITSNFRPFPWEAGGFLPAAASLELIFLGVVILWHRSEIWAGLKGWRSNGMVVTTFLAWAALSIILTALPNFGELARERTQLLPFLFMMIAWVPKPHRRARREPAPRAVTRFVPA